MGLLDLRWPSNSYSEDSSLLSTSEGLQPPLPAPILPQTSYLCSHTLTYRNKVRGAGGGCWRAEWPRANLNDSRSQILKPKLGPHLGSGHVVGPATHHSTFVNVVDSSSACTGIYRSVLLGLAWEQAGKRASVLRMGLGKNLCPLHSCPWEAEATSKNCLLYYFHMSSQVFFQHSPNLDPTWSLNLSNNHMPDAIVATEKRWSYQTLTDILELHTTEEKGDS